jgi:hypothetical protein
VASGPHHSILALQRPQNIVVSAVPSQLGSHGSDNAQCINGSDDLWLELDHRAPSFVHQAPSNTTVGQGAVVRAPQSLLLLMTLSHGGVVLVVTQLVESLPPHHGLRGCVHQARGARMAGAQACSIMEVSGGHDESYCDAPRHHRACVKHCHSHIVIHTSSTIVSALSHVNCAPNTAAREGLPLVDVKPATVADLRLLPQVGAVR